MQRLKGDVMVEQVTEESFNSRRGVPRVSVELKFETEKKFFPTGLPALRTPHKISQEISTNLALPFKRSYETFMMDCLVSRQRQPVSNCIRLISFPFQFLVAHSRRLTRTRENKERSWNPKRKYSWKYASERRLKFTHSGCFWVGFVGSAIYGPFRTWNEHFSLLDFIALFLSTRRCWGDDGKRPTTVVMSR